MSAAVRPAAYLTALAAIFGGALAVGSAAGDGDPRPADHPAAGDGMAGMAGEAHGGHGAGESNPPAAHGLGVAENGLRLVAHVHPLEGGADTGRIAFAATHPSAGRYRLFLQFRHAGRVHTAALTQEVATA